MELTMGAIAMAEAKGRVVCLGMAVHACLFAIHLHNAVGNAKRTIERSHRFD
jgi:hypothetical protein